MDDNEEWGEGEMEHLEDILDDLYIGDCVCALCDEGGDLLCCEGGCMRAFHATKESGAASQCQTLRMRQHEVQNVSSWACPNCVASIHQCYICGDLGSSAPDQAQEVFKCGESGCGHFYHLHCLAEVVSMHEGHSNADAIAVKEAEYKKLGFFRCPLHFCLGCGQLEKTGVQNWLVKCRRCPKAYHVECLPFGLRYSKTVETKGTFQRVWGVDDEFPQRVMYCSDHAIDSELETPVRDHLQFPASETSIVKPFEEIEFSLSESFSSDDETPLNRKKKLSKAKQLVKSLVHNQHGEISAEISRHGRRDTYTARYKKASTSKDAQSRPTKKLRQESSIYTKLLDPSPQKVPQSSLTSNNKIALLLQKTSDVKGLGKLSCSFQEETKKSHPGGRIPSKYPYTVADPESEDEGDLLRIAKAASKGRAAVLNRQVSEKETQIASNIESVRYPGFRGAHQASKGREENLKHRQGSRQQSHFTSWTEDENLNLSHETSLIDSDFLEEDVGIEEIVEEIIGAAEKAWSIQKIEEMLKVAKSYIGDGSKPSVFARKREIQSLSETINQTVDSAMKVLHDPLLSYEQAGEKVVEMLRVESLKQLEAIESILAVQLAPFLHGRRYTSFGRHFTMQEKLKEIVERLHWYIDDGDMVVDTSCGSNEWSLLLAEKLDAHGKKKCKFKNFDICETSNPFHFEKRDWFDVRQNDLEDGKKLILGLNPPFGQLGGRAKAFVERMFSFEPKLVILIAPKQTEMDDPRYELLWKDSELLKGQAFYLPGSINDRGDVIAQHNLEAPPLFLYGLKAFSSKHRAISAQHKLEEVASGKLPPILEQAELQRGGKTDFIDSN